MSTTLQGPTGVGSFGRMKQAVQRPDTAKILPPDFLPAVYFHFIIPAATAAVFGANHSGSARHMSVFAGTLYWLGITLFLWNLLYFASRFAIGIHLRRPQLPRWAALGGAVVVALLAFDPFLAVYSAQVFSALTDEVPYTPPVSPLEILNDPSLLLVMVIVPLYWFTGLTISDRLLNYPGFLRAREPVPIVHAKPPLAHAGEGSLPELRDGLFADVPIGIGTDVASIHAEDHYIRVHTTLGSALVRYRFSDALQELQGLHGIRIHRSHWVRVSAISTVLSDKDKKYLKLNDGRTVPVSRSYHGVLRSIDLL